MIISNAEKELTINPFVVLEATRIPESVAVLAGKFVELPPVFADHVVAFLVGVTVCFVYVCIVWSVSLDTAGIYNAQCRNFSEIFVFYSTRSSRLDRNVDVWP